MENFILTNENAIYFECGFSCDNVIYLNLGSERYFITDARYTIEAKEFSKNCQVIESKSGKDLIETAKKILKKSKIKGIVFDPYDFSYFLYESLSSDSKIKFIPEAHFSKIKRIIKKDWEVEILTKASQLGRDGFKNLAKYIKEHGYKQKESFLHFKAMENMSQVGKYDLSFSPIVGINANAAKPHALPGNKKLRTNDLLLVDAGIKYKRYCSDRTCTANVDFNTLSFERKQTFRNKKYQKIYDLVYKAQLNAIEKARVGMKASQIDRLTREVIEKEGYGKYFVHGTGHGVGLDIHEFPNINPTSDVIIEDNMVFTIEPGIYLPNEFGVRIEDSVVMKNGKAKII